MIIKSMDYFQRLRSLLNQDTLNNLKTLHQCKIITATSCSYNAQKILSVEFKNTLNFLLENYNNQGSNDQIEQKLLNGQTYVLTTIWDKKIAVLILKLHKYWKWCGLRKYDYCFENTSFFLNLEISDKLFDPQLLNILKWPTKKKIREFLNN